MSLRLGELAPVFTLPDQHGHPTSLEGYRGRALLVVFYPFAFTGVCTGELQALRDGGAARLADVGAAVVAVSCDPVFALRVFADRDEIGLPLLSDFWPHGQVARAYGAFDDERGCPTRSTFLVDGGGRLRWSVRSPAGRARDVDAYVGAARALSTAE